MNLQPTREFPGDPSNTAGFDNSGESLAMSSALLKKYLEAARDVANHMFLRPEGFAFVLHLMLAETDRDKHCVQQIINFYHRQDLDYADYFQAAWRFKHRAALGKRPVWVREGAAIYFAGEQMIPGEPQQRPAFKPAPRGSCPDDNELLHPVSVGALSNAYARARSCFAKQLHAGRNWKDVR